MNRASTDSGTSQPCRADQVADPQQTDGARKGPGEQAPLSSASLEAGGTPALNSSSQLAKSSASRQSEPVHTENRLHSATLWLPCIEVILGSIVPVLITSLFLPFPVVLFFTICFGVLPAAVFHIFRYIHFRFWLTETELVLHSGILFRRERRIPFDRVQEVEIHQSLFQRPLALAAVKLSTAGSDAEEANLNVLRADDAQLVKRTINGFPSVAPESSGVADVAETTPDYVCELSTRDLLLGGVTSRLVATLGAIVATLVYFQLFLGIGGRWMGGAKEALDEQINGRWDEGQAVESLFEVFQSWLPDFGPFNFFANLFFDETLPKSLGLVFLGLAASVATYVVRYHGFRLVRTGDLLSSSYGLLSRRRSGLLRDRIQALKLEEGLLRRYFGLAAIRVDSAGDRQQIDETKQRDVLVPVATREVAEELARQTMPGLTQLAPHWNRVSPKAIMRGTKKGWLLLLLALLQTFGVAGWYCLALLPAVPAIYLLNQQWYYHTGYWLDDNHFLSRRGWLNRATVCLPITNIQNVTVTQNLFDRRLDLATLSLDTAGQSNTGGGPVIRHIPVEEAKQMQQTLAKKVAGRTFTW